MTIRAWAGAVFFLLLGCFIGHWATVTVRPPLGCGSGEFRVLTKDVDLNRDAEVATHVHGVLRRGSLFEVRWTKGRMSYIAVHSALPADLIERVSTTSQEASRLDSTNDHGRVMADMSSREPGGAAIKTFGW